MKRPAAPLRLLTAVPICDGHDSAINTINLEFIRHGIEVIYLGYHRSVRDIVRAAIQEDVRAVGISSYNGGHVEFFSQVVRELKRYRAGHIGVFGGGGGTITPADAKKIRRNGVGEIFFPGTPIQEIVDHVLHAYGSPRKATLSAAKTSGTDSDPTIARRLTLAEESNRSTRARKHNSHVIGITGPGGAGKTTLIDDLVRRFLQHDANRRIAILSHDPSVIGKGALLGDSATMIYSQDDRVFMRSLSTRGTAGGLSAATQHALDTLLTCRAHTDGRGFDAVILETVGVGQEAVPFGSVRVDKSIFVTSPEYGSTLQLQKIAMLDVVDVVVVNKSDMPGAPTALAELQQRLAPNNRQQIVISTTAKRFGDEGVGRLFDLLIKPTVQGGQPS